MLILHQEVYLSSLCRKFHYLIIAHVPLYKTSSSYFPNI